LSFVRIPAQHVLWLFQFVFPFLVFFFVFASLVGAERTEWLRGYRRTLAGETISYHSPYPDSNSALLVRATDGKMAIEWETEPVPETFRKSGATFIWMSGMATGKGAHRFDLEINGSRALTFATPQDSSRRAWTVKGTNGVSMSFETALVDPFNELFGFVLLTVPPALLRPGEPLRLKVTGESGGSPDWFMVFEDDLKPGIAVKSEQVTVRKNGALRQLLRVEISHIAPAADAVISAGDEDRIMARLLTGYNIFCLSVPAVGRERDAVVEVAVEGRPALKAGLRVKPVAPREIWLLPHSHVDIGYSDPQPVVEKNHWKYYEDAIRLAGQSAGNPEGARFKWNVEQLWAVETYLRQANDDARRRFIDAVRGGAIGLQAALAGELTGLCHPEELFHLTDFARKIAGLTGKTIDSAMVTDIPSQAWSIVPGLAQAGVKYLSSGPNYMPNLPDGGDRIGWTLKTWGDRPFYWVSPSGDEKVLFWMAGRGYSWFHGLHLGSIGCAPCARIFDYVDELADRDYPYSMIQVRYTIGGDNGPPDPGLADFVKDWNAQYESPKLVIATSSEMFAELERRHGDIIPSVRGDFTPYWEDGAASTALETAVNREAAERLLRAETLWALVAPDRYPSEKFYEAWRQVLLFDEHTWGASDSISNPDGENAKGQWEYKKAFAAGADRASRELLAEVEGIQVSGAGRSARTAIDVFNSCSWPRTDVAILSKEMSASGDLVKDASGNPVPSQRLSTGELAFLASGVPGMGAKRFFIENGAALAGGEARVQANTLENGRMSVAVDPMSGAVRSLRWTNGPSPEIVDSGRYPGLNHYLYVAGRDPKAAAGVLEVTVRPGETGPLISSLVVESGAPGARSLRREVQLVHGSDRLEFRDTIDKEKVRDKESVHIAFPFNVPGGVVRVDTGWAFVRPEADQIPGGCRDFFCAQKSVDVSNEDYGVTWTSLDAPLVEIGEITDETLKQGHVRAWRKTIPPSEILISYVMNNYWHTNYKADQEGRVTLGYAVQPHGGFDTAVIRRLGLEAARPLLPVPADEARPVPGFGLSVGPQQFIVTSLKPSEDGRGWMVRIFNAGARPAGLRLSGPLAGRGSLYLSNLLEEKLKWTAGQIEVPGFGIVTLRVDR
jgi:alpha-mannosidase